MGVGFKEVLEDELAPVVTFNYYKTKVQINSGQLPFLYLEANKGRKKPMVKVESKTISPPMAPQLRLFVQEAALEHPSFFRNIVFLSTENELESKFGRKYPIASTLKNYELTIETKHE